MLRYCPKCSYPNPASRETCFKCGYLLKTLPDPEIIVVKNRTDENICIEKESEENKCFRCGKELYNLEYNTKLCSACRNKLVHYPIPAWLFCLNLLFIIIMILSIPQWINSINNGIYYERGLIAEENKDYNTASRYYNGLYNKYPSSPVLLARIVIVLYKSGHKKEALIRVQQLQGRTLPIFVGKELTNTIPEIIIKK